MHLDDTDAIGIKKRAGKCPARSDGDHRHFRPEAVEENDAIPDSFADSSFGLYWRNGEQESGRCCAGSLMGCPLFISSFEIPRYLSHHKLFLFVIACLLHLDQELLSFFLLKNGHLLSVPIDKNRIVFRYPVTENFFIQSTFFIDILQTTHTFELFVFRLPRRSNISADLCDSMNEMDD